MRSNLRCWPGDIFVTDAGKSVTCPVDVLDDGDSVPGEVTGSELSHADMMNSKIIINNPKVNALMGVAKCWATMPIFCRSMGRGRRMGNGRNRGTYNFVFNKSSGIRIL